MSLQLINQYSIAGTSIAPSYNNQQDYLLRIAPLVHDAQNYIATTAKKIFAQHPITQNPITNVIKGYLDLYGVKQHLKTDQLFSADSAASYYFEVDNSATITFESGNTVLKTITFLQDKTGFTAFKGLLPETVGVTIRFSGLYPYNFRNVCLYGNTFVSDTAVPNYKKYNEYTMPDDFFELAGRGIPHTQGTNFTMSHTYRWRGRNVLLLDSSLVGEWLIDYYRYPAPITSSSLETSPLDNQPEAQLCIPYYVAAHLCYADDPNLYSTLMNEFELKISRMGESVQSEVTQIEDVYAGLSGSWCG